jgi:hypothetical protein
MSSFEYNIKEMLNTNIYIVDDVFNDTECNELINFIENHKKEREIKIVNCYSFYLSQKNEEDKKIDFMVYEKIRKILSSVAKINPYLSVTGDVQYHFRKIIGETELHVDEVRSSNADYLLNKTRCMAIIFNLNDDYNGGEFIFPHQSIKIKLKKGQVLLFPPFWTHPHKVNTVSSPRYTITTWGTEDIM